MPVSFFEEFDDKLVRMLDDELDGTVDAVLDVFSKSERLKMKTQHFLI